MTGGYLSPHFFYADCVILSAIGGRKYPKNAAKTNGFGFLARARYGAYRNHSTPRIKQCKLVPCFRIASASIHRDALRACAGRPNRENLCVCRAARCGERIERCRWRMKRNERVIAVKILRVCREAAQKFWAPQQGYRSLQSAARGAMCGRGRAPLLRAARTYHTGRTGSSAPTISIFPILSCNPPKNAA